MVVELYAAEEEPFDVAWRCERGVGVSCISTSAGRRCEGGFIIASKIVVGLNLQIEDPTTY